MLFVTKEPLFPTPPTLPKVTGVSKYKPNIFFQGRENYFQTPVQPGKKFLVPPVLNNTPPFKKLSYRWEGRLLHPAYPLTV
jgi:hypothetical protein